MPYNNKSMVMKKIFYILIINAVFLGLTGDNQLFAQFKNIRFSEKPAIQKDNIRLRFNHDQYRDATFTGQVDFSSNLNGLSLQSVKNGLRPGPSNRLGLPASIEGNLTESGKRGNTPEALAMEYLAAAAPLMRQQDPENHFIVKSVDTDELGMVHVRMQQHMSEIPIYGTEIIVHGSAEGMHFLNGNYVKVQQRGLPAPVLNSTEAAQAVTEELGNTPRYFKDIRHVGDLTPKTTLIWYPVKDTLLLAYHVVAYKNIIERWEYFIDAGSGSKIHAFQSICKFHNHNHDTSNDCAEESPLVPLLDGKATANAVDLFNISRLINTYQVGTKFYLIDGSRDIFSSVPADLPNDPKGVIWTIDAFNTSPAKDNFNYDHVTTSNNIWSNKTSVSSHFNGGKAFEYFRNTHNRKSINGTGGNIISLINVADEDGSSLGNAFWNGQAMFYGNGDGAFQPLARGLDVAGHEMAHGVIQSTANLEYEGESGALNESFADVFGAMIDRDDWKIGEDVVKTNAYPSGALRNMENPHNGAATNDFNRGWQPRHYNERFTGTADNGGVHINSGIPNFAFFKFATAIGKDKAEKVFFRALSSYLTKSSQFVDCRVAVVKAAGDLFGSNEVNAARKAFDEVGITGEQGGDYENDAPSNPGQEFILTTGADQEGLFIHDAAGEELAQLTSKTLISKPSITDDGSIILYVTSDNRLYFAEIDWAQGTFRADQIVDDSPVWRAAAISKDGKRLAGLFEERINQILVFDFPTQSQKIFELYNPTFTQGISTGDVNYADALEFDITGEYLMYDAENEIKSNTAGSITYWDISFIEVWDKAKNKFAEGGISKLFTSLPEGVSVGNPTFSKNSPYIIAFDYLDDDNNMFLLGANIESGAVSQVFKNNALSFPSYGIKDTKIVFDNEGSFSLNVGLVNMKTNKIEPASNPVLFLNSKRWAIWFSNGKRVLSSLQEPLSNNSFKIRILENPVNDRLRLLINPSVATIQDIEIMDISGKTYTKYHDIPTFDDEMELPLGELSEGFYILKVKMDGTIQNLKFLKKNR